ncbi:Nn.00g008190.m01.CDS01 [Neocucurbitaria sp. VM-36]
MHSINFLLLSAAVQLTQSRFLSTTSLDATLVSTSSLQSSGFPVAATDDTSWPATTVAPPLPDHPYNSTNAQVNSTDCTPRPIGKGPVPIPDQTWAFLNFPAFEDMSLHAPTPTNWTRAFVAEKGSSLAVTYIGYSELEWYDTNNCSAQCDKVDRCKAFNIYFERTPTLHLAYECQDAPSSTVIKCVFWGEKLYDTDVRNWGRRDWKFDVVLAGSNGYNRKQSREISGASESVTSTLPLLGAIGLAVHMMVVLATFVLAFF